MTDLDVMLDRVSAEYSKRLSTKGVRFVLGVKRRVRGRGIARTIRLHVWPVTGFDDFEWDFEVRHWFGGQAPHLTVLEAERAITEVLDAYEAGAGPPFSDESRVA
jgi:hypothetical protein